MLEFPRPHVKTDGRSRIAVGGEACIVLKFFRPHVMAASRHGEKVVFAEA